jgi:hypothetical protein
VTDAARRSSGAFAAATNLSLRCFPVISQSFFYFSSILLAGFNKKTHQQTGLYFEEETNEVVHFEDSFV